VLRTDLSIPCVTGGARERDSIADIGKAGDIGAGALEPPTPPSPTSGGRVREGVVLLIDAALGQAVIRHVEPLLTPAAAHDLAER